VKRERLRGQELEGQFMAIKIAIVLILTVVSQPADAIAQSSSTDGVMSDLVAQVTEVETKIVAPAKAIPESAYDWRPGDGVRSTSEVFRHVAGENYFAGAKIGGTTPPSDTGITGKAHQEAISYEERKMARAQVITALEQSFAFLKKSMADTPVDRLESLTDYSGRKVTTRTAWLFTTTHLHEHRGQLIAYARSNKVVPPWSR
jgi:uncharacterized damage-inducible protein DinB